jgi:toxin ParE1/3/4
MHCFDQSAFSYAILPRYFDKGIRRIVHGSYLIFYSVVDDKIIVLRVLHSAVDVDVQMREG